MVPLCPLLASKNICCVGDGDQSIYGWRGDEVVDNILRFEHDLPGACAGQAGTQLPLHWPYPRRSLASDRAYRGAVGKTLRTEDVESEKVTVTGSWDPEEEARAIGEEIEQLQRDATSQRCRDPGAGLVPDA